MSTTGAAAPDDTAVRTALRRAPHLSGGEDFPIAAST